MTKCDLTFSSFITRMLIEERLMCNITTIIVFTVNLELKS